MAGSPARGGPKNPQPPAPQPEPVGAQHQQQQKQQPLQPTKLNEVAFFQVVQQGIHQVASGHFVAATTDPSSSKTAAASSSEVAFYHLSLLSGRISLTVALDPPTNNYNSKKRKVQNQARSVFVLTGVKQGQGEASGADAAGAGSGSGGSAAVKTKSLKSKSSWLVSYGPTVIIVIFFVYQWARNWAKSSPMFQEIWKKAQEQAKKTMPDAYAASNFAEGKAS